jgi:hypothetical protein
MTATQSQVLSSYPTSSQPHIQATEYLCIQCINILFIPQGFLACQDKMRRRARVASKMARAPPHPSGCRGTACRPLTGRHSERDTKSQGSGLAWRVRDHSCSAGVSPAVAGASRSRKQKAFAAVGRVGPSLEQTRCKRARAGCPRHSGRDARATSGTSAFASMSQAQGSIALEFDRLTG